MTYGWTPSKFGYEVADLHSQHEAAMLTHANKIATRKNQATVKFRYGCRNSGVGT